MNNNPTVEQLIDQGDFDRAIEMLQSMANTGEGGIGQYDMLAELLTQQNRWAEAAPLYEYLVQKRGKMFGFHAPPPLEDTFAVLTPGKFAEMRKLLARLSTHYWAEDLVNLLGTEQENPSDTKVWPLGRTLPERQYIRLPTTASVQPEKLVSIMLPVYDIQDEGWLRDALDDIFAQDLASGCAEVVIVDDASPNTTAQKIAESYGSRVRYLRNSKNRGLLANHNRCLAEARGEFVHILHQDDRIKPGFYDALLPPLQQDDSLQAAFCQVGYISERSQPTGLEKALQPRGVLQNWHIKLSVYRIQFSSIIVRRSTFRTIGGFSPSLQFAFDWDMWNRISASGPIWYEPQMLAQFRVHGGSATATFGWQERVIDAMWVVAHMVRSLPDYQRRATAELAMHKFFYRYWCLITDLPFEQTTRGQKDLMEFLMQGWVHGVDKENIKKLLERLRPIARPS
jgi:glycosyltransferase involved in cell wall biosynthesis